MIMPGTGEWESKATRGKRTGVTAFLEGVNFWIREDAIDEQGVLIDPAVSQNLILHLEMQQLSAGNR